MGAGASRAAAVKALPIEACPAPCEAAAALGRVPVATATTSGSRRKQLEVKGSI